MNIYYKGGNIAKVNSEKQVHFDAKYLIDPDSKKEKTGLVDLFRKQNYQGYFKKSRQIMDHWFEAHPKPERGEQHSLAMANQYFQSDYTILDIEYQVSAQSEFYCTFIPTGKKDPKKPRFDIDAVNKQGQVAVIELKKGVKALSSTSGLQEHLDCYNASIGRNSAPFMDEMKNLLKQKQALGLIDKALTIALPPPVFMFAYSFDDSLSEEEQYKRFMKACGNVKSNVPVPILWLRHGTHQLLDP